MNKNPALDAIQWPIVFRSRVADLGLENPPNESAIQKMRVFSNADSRTLLDRLAVVEGDIKDAAGELLVDVPVPGSEGAKLLSAFAFIEILEPVAGYAIGDRILRGMGMEDETYNGHIIHKDTGKWIQIPENTFRRFAYASSDIRPYCVMTEIDNGDW